uniref:Histone H2A deubiquitinase MYSM1 n=1 Tax=Anthurium amnicola TaxID=1678845 RepID=A0A1D1XTM8_9ARAE
MAASANPCGNQDAAHGPSSFHGSGGDEAGGNPSNGHSTAPLPDNSASAQALKHNPGLAVEWTPDEQSILEEGLSKYTSEPSIVRYAKIAMQLHDKTVRDVALRCKWMNKKESGKRKKDDHNLSKKHNKKGVSDPSAKASAQLAARPSVPPYPLPMLPIDNDDEVSYKAIGGTTGQLLEQNAQHFRQISANLSSYQVQESINLFCQIQENILTILNDMNEMPNVMKQMPPLPVKLNEELANSILPHRTSMPMQS